MPSNYLLLFPEDVANAVSHDRPFYAEVISTTRNHAIIQEREQPNAVARIPRGLVASRIVSANEYQAGQPGHLVRQAVAFFNGTTPTHGQVISYNDTRLTVQTATGTTETTHDQVVEIAPVLYFLLANARLSRISSLDQLSDAHHRILDRLLGDNGHQPTRDIASLLDGIVARRYHPKPHAILGWVNPLGATVSVSVQHAVDYGFAVDGSGELPADVTVGSAYWDDPTARSRNAPASQLASLLSELSDSDESDTAQEQPSNPPPTTTSTSAANQDLIQQLSRNPDLLQTLLTALVSSTRKRRRSTSDSSDDSVIHRPAPSSRRLEGHSDLVGTSVATDRRPRDEFRPHAAARTIYDALVSSTHKGKIPSTLMDFAVSCSATKFIPHPAILSRLYAFEFGVYGLSVQHFKRVDHRARRARLAQQQFNPRNFSNAIDLPRPPELTDIQDLRDRLAVLSVFSEEFFDRTTRRLVAAAGEFVEELRSLITWGPDELGSITQWFDNIFEDYRRAVEADASQGTRTRSTIISRFSMQDASLQTVLLVIQDERFTAMRAPTSDHSTRRVDQRPPPHRDDRPARQIPDDVFNAIPRHGGKRICLRFISNRGCPSQHPDRCVAPQRAHAFPRDLPNIVRRYVEDTYGGLRKRDPAASSI